MKIVTIVGARPQFVKAAVLSRAFQQTEDIEEIIVHTGQHFDENMSNVFFEEMGIPSPNVNLNINGLNHGAMTGQMLEEIEKILISQRPDWVLVYGDTNSTLAGALAAKKLHIKVAHVEAGLRSFNMNMPEEINRILTDRISDILFCPTDTAINNLHAEGYENFNSLLINVGDIMQEATMYYADRAKRPKFLASNNFILCTVHRAENTDSKENLFSLIRALEMISVESTVVLPLHPRTKSKLTGFGYSFSDSNIQFEEPVGYLEMIYLLKYCDMVLTDSGGLQKEAYFFEKKCITLREETEWLELVESGNNIIAGCDYKKIYSSFGQLRDKKNTKFDRTLYGNGDTSLKIIKSLLDYN